MNFLYVPLEHQPGDGKTFLIPQNFVHSVSLEMAQDETNEPPSEIPAYEPEENVFMSLIRVDSKIKGFK